MAEVILRSLVAGAGLSDRVGVSSAGTGPWHEGEPMDPRAREALAAAGYTDHGHIAHQFDPSSAGDLDLAVALDRRHRQTLESLAGHRLDGRLTLLRSFDATAGGAVDVPDPYYGDTAEFAGCLRMIEAGCGGLAAALEDALAAGGSLAGRRGPVAGDPG
jgi:protein-tyrosine phosphatase